MSFHMSDIGITYKFLYKLSQYSEIPAVKPARSPVKCVRKTLCLLLFGIAPFRAEKVTSYISSTILLKF